MGNSESGNPDEPHDPILTDFTVDEIATQIKDGRAKRIIVMSGAGMSVAAGIPDFRSPNTGLYAQLAKYDLPTPEAIFELNYFREHPEPFFTLAKELWPGNFDPTDAHLFLKLLDQKNLLLRNFTQNIDGLERLAGVHAGLLIECHGSFFTAHTVDPPYKSVFIDDVKRRIFAGETDIRDDETGSLIKPDVIFFGETLPERFYYFGKRDFPTCDLLIVMGTSLTVDPFAGLASMVPDTCPRLLINNEIAGDFRCGLKNNWRDVGYIGDVQDGVNFLVQKLGWEKEFEELKAQFPNRRLLKSPATIPRLVGLALRSPEVDSSNGLSQVSSWESRVSSPDSVTPPTHTNPSSLNAEEERPKSGLTDRLRMGGAGLGSDEWENDSEAGPSKSKPITPITPEATITSSSSSCSFNPQKPVTPTASTSNLTTEVIVQEWGKVVVPEATSSSTTSSLPTTTPASYCSSSSWKSAQCKASKPITCGFEDEWENEYEATPLPANMGRKPLIELDGYVETVGPDPPNPRTSWLPQMQSKPILTEFTLDEIAKRILNGQAQKIIVMTGAGISVAAGIPDFRSPETGLYAQLAKYDLPFPEAVFELDYFREHPEPFFVLAKEMWPGNFDPTDAHLFIKLLEEKGLLLRNFTQNIDCLERAAGIGTNVLVECHGTFASAHTIDPPNKEISVDELKKRIEAGETNIRDHETGSLIKPDIVFFGEDLPGRFYLCSKLDFPSCDLLIVMGTSLTVDPFASMSEMVDEECPRVLINNEMAGDFRCGMKDNLRDVGYIGDVQEGVRYLIKKLGWTEEFAKLRARFPDRREKKTPAMIPRLAGLAARSPATENASMSHGWDSGVSSPYYKPVVNTFSSAAGSCSRSNQFARGRCGLVGGEDQWENESAATPLSTSTAQKTPMEISSSASSPIHPAWGRKLGKSNSDEWEGDHSVAKVVMTPPRASLLAGSKDQPSP